MSLKDKWVDLEDATPGVQDSGSDLSVGPINDLAHAIIDLEEKGGDSESPLPSPTTEGAFLRVENGKWAESVLPNLDEEEF